MRGEAQSRCGPETVLVVEDDTALRKLAEKHLDRLGYQVVSVSDGIAALEALDSGQGVDVLMTDVVLPGNLSGIELAGRLEQRFPSIGVLIVSGYGHDVPGEFGVASDDYEVLAKPYNRQELAVAIQRALDKGAV